LLRVLAATAVLSRQMQLVGIILIFFLYACSASTSMVSVRLGFREGNRVVRSDAINIPVPPQNTIPQQNDAALWQGFIEAVSQAHGLKQADRLVLLEEGSGVEVQSLSELDTSEVIWAWRELRGSGRDQVGVGSETESGEESLSSMSVLRLWPTPVYQALDRKAMAINHQLRKSLLQMEAPTHPPNDPDPSCVCSLLADGCCCLPAGHCADCNEIQSRWLAIRHQPL